jgi:hypothetical protein
LGKLDGGVEIELRKFNAVALVNLYRFNLSTFKSSEISEKHMAAAAISGDPQAFLINMHVHS